jgi:hypothetical protein
MLEHVLSCEFLLHASYQAYQHFLFQQQNLKSDWFWFLQHMQNQVNK